LTEVRRHHDAVIDRDAEQGNEADPHRRIQLDPVDRQHDHPAGKRDRDAREHGQGNRQPAELQIDDQQG